MPESCIDGWRKAREQVEVEFLRSRDGRNLYVGHVIGAVLGARAMRSTILSVIEQPFCQSSCTDYLQIDDC